MEFIRWTRKWLARFREHVHCCAFGLHFMVAFGVRRVCGFPLGGCELRLPSAACFHEYVYACSNGNTRSVSNRDRNSNTHCHRDACSRTHALRYTNSIGDAFANFNKHANSDLAAWGHAFEDARPNHYACSASFNKYSQTAIFRRRAGRESPYRSFHLVPDCESNAFCSNCPNGWYQDFNTTIIFRCCFAFFVASLWNSTIFHHKHIGRFQFSPLVDSCGVDCSVGIEPA